MFRHPAWAVGSYSSGPAAARIKSTVGFNQADVSPCTVTTLEVTDRMPSIWRGRGGFVTYLIRHTVILFDIPIIILFDILVCQYVSAEFVE